MMKGLERGSKLLKSAGINPHTSLLKGNPPKQIMKYMAANNIDLLVLTRNPRSKVPSLEFGNVGDVLARRAPCPVLIVKGAADPTVKKILNPTDGKKDSIPAGRLAIALANHFNAELTKFYVGENESLGEEILTNAENAARRDGVSHISRSEVVKGDPADNIIAIADGYDLIVMGKGNKSFFKRDLLCLTSREVVAVANSPVLLVG
jgi:nucleotide-binding universal stress UspA family protein